MMTTGVNPIVAVQKNMIKKSKQTDAKRHENT